MKVCPKCLRKVIEKKPGSDNEYLCPWMNCGMAGWNAGYGKVGVIPVDMPQSAPVKFEFTKPLFSLIVAYSYSSDKGRQEGLARLMKSIKSQTIKNFELIVVEQIINGENKFPYKDQVDKYITIKDPENRAFNKSWVMNVGARQASSINLLFHDADVIFESDFLEKVQSMINYFPLFECWSNFVTLTGKDNPFIRIHIPKSISCLIGVWFCNKDYFFKVLGGYNESYFGYGREDNDIWTRANYICNKHIPFLDYTLTHVYHDWHPDNGANPYNKNDDDGNKRLAFVNKNPKEIIDILVETDIGNPIKPRVI